MTAESQKLPSGCQPLRSTSAHFLTADPPVRATLDRVTRHLRHVPASSCMATVTPQHSQSSGRNTSHPWSPPQLTPHSEHHGAQPHLLSLIPQCPMPKQPSPQLLLISSAAEKGKRGMLTRPPSPPGIVMKGSREQSVGPEVVSINLQDLMVSLWTNIY